MENARFDALARSLAKPASRRGLIAGFAGFALSLAGLGRADAAACRAFERTCTENAQCCSGECGPKDLRGRRSCAAGPEGCMYCDQSNAGFFTVAHGTPVYRACAPGTECRPTTPCSIVCDWPSQR